MSNIQIFSAPLGRFFISIIFVMAGLNKIVCRRLIRKWGILVHEAVRVKKINIMGEKL